MEVEGGWESVVVSSWLVLAGDGPLRVSVASPAFSVVGNTK